ncbi:MAG: cytochrome c3 family protein [Phycisphaeraceae bacterium]
MASNANATRFMFPRWANYLLPLLVLGAVGGGLYVPVVIGFGLSADTLWRGYAPAQPVPFSHALHAGELGMDCRYCHTTVEDASFAAIPHTQVCISCHSPEDNIAGVRKNSELLGPVHASYETGESVEWIKVHDQPDYVYFSHSAHVNRGVSCVECHGRVDRMERVYMAENMSMAWCLDCHREPEQALRPVDEVTNLAWDPRDELGVSRDTMTRAEAQRRVGLELKDEYNIHNRTYMTSCSTCHR